MKFWDWSWKSAMIKICPSRKENENRLFIHPIFHKAKLIKLADKISNVHDIAFAPPDHWSLQRRIEYLQWAEDVVAGLRGINKNLEKHFDETLASARQRLNEENKENPDL